MSGKIEEQLKKLEGEKKAGNIGSKEFYHGLLRLVSTLSEELENENLSEDLIRKQVPFLLAFLKTQIRELKARGN
ncbi:MAG: hypothetical protein GXO18_00150 [Aquificae bacterium]|nr:hypothetical protein [Aquificota bacterium]